MPLNRQKNSDKAAMFPVQRRERRYFSRCIHLTTLFFQLNAVNPAEFPAKRR